MATVVLGTAGAVTGGIFGGGWAGAKAGWMIGSTIGAIVDQKIYAQDTEKPEQPQIGDLTVTSSAAGIPRR